MEIHSNRLKRKEYRKKCLKTKLNQIRNAAKRSKSTPKRIVAGDLAGNIAGYLAGDLAANLIGNLAGTLARTLEVAQHFQPRFGSLSEIDFQKKQAFCLDRMLKKVAMSFPK